MHKVVRLSNRASMLRKLICSFRTVNQNVDLHFTLKRFTYLSVVSKSKLQPTRCNVSWFIYFYRRSTCFRRFLRPSSGAHNCTHSFRYFLPIPLLAAIVDEMELEFHLIHDSSKQQYWLTLHEAVCIVVCSWWWEEKPPETCTASVEINKSRNVASCWL